MVQLVPWVMQHWQSHKPQLDPCYRDAVWALRRFCEGDPPPSANQVQSALRTFTSLLHEKHTEICMCACQALASISTSPTDHIEALFQEGIYMYTLVHLLNYDTFALPVLVIIGNIFKSRDAHVRKAETEGALEILGSILENKRTNFVEYGEHTGRAILHKVCRVISILTRASKHRIQMVIDADLINPLLSIVRDPRGRGIGVIDIEVKYEALKALTCTIWRGSFEQINENLVKEGFIQILMEQLYSENPRIRVLSMDCLRQLLNKGAQDHESNGVNPYAEVGRQQGLFNVLKSFQGPRSLKNSAHWILTRFGRPEEQVIQTRWGWVSYGDGVLGSWNLYQF